MRDYYEEKRKANLIKRLQDCEAEPRITVRHFIYALVGAGLFLGAVWFFGVLQFILEK